MLMQKFGVTNREHYGMLWYFGIFGAVNLSKTLKGLPMRLVLFENTEYYIIHLLRVRVKGQ